MSKKILITGSSAGFGLLTVKTLLKEGYKVAASMRSPEGRNKEVAQNLAKLGAKIVEIDVTNEKSVNAGVQKATQDLGGLDVVINNAGVGVHGLQENFTVEDFQKVFDINVFGVQRISRAVLPLFRENKSGLIINVSSLLGRITIPFYGPYNASKWALEAMTENYRWELTPFGVDVVLVEPGGYPTTFMDRLIYPSDSTRNNSYGDMAHAPKAALEGFEQALASNTEQNPQDVANTILKVIQLPQGKRPLRFISDKMGMGAALSGYNDQLGNITKGIFETFGSSQLYR